MTSHLEQFAAYRGYLFTLACRMLGRAEDAEDLLQETFLRWHETSLQSIRSPKAFLTTVVKNLCANHLRSARVRKEECVEATALEALQEQNDQVLEPFSVSESLNAGLAILLERLSSNERAVFLLREVFDCEFDEIAVMLEKNATNCRQILKRAREHLTSSQARFAASANELDLLARQFARTCATGDLPALVAALY
jgi:RNA polymerase sigma-70 factor (ECF subfamily)